LRGATFHRERVRRHDQLQTLTYNVVGQIISVGYAYDGVGNLTAVPGQTFTYNRSAAAGFLQEGRC
jgi:hypothetical protein